MTTATPGTKKKPALRVDLIPEGKEAEDTLVTMLSKIKIAKMDLKKSDFEDIGELGSGAGGVVHKSKHNPTGTIMAKKVINIATTPEERKLIEKELEFLKDFNSPHIVAFHGAFMSDNEIHVCLEYMDVGSFDVIYRKTGPLPEEILGKIAVSVLEALVYLYKTYKIVHRDIKPSNMLLNSRGHVKICDFGVSGVIQDSVKKKAQTFVGTSYYMSPARVQGHEYSVRSDSWSVGMSLLEMAIGHFPIQFKQDPKAKKEKMGVFDLILVIVKEPPPKVPQDAGFSLEFQDFIAKCLLKDEATRDSPEQLLSHPFVTKMRPVRVDMSGWAHQVLDL